MLLPWLSSRTSRWVCLNGAAHNHCLRSGLVGDLVHRPNLLSFPLAGVLNVLYLVNSIGECVDSKCRWNEQSTCVSISRDCACDLDAGSIGLLLLSSLTSAAMFALKISKLKVIKLSLDMEILRTHQHEELTAELQAMLSPSDFRRVSGVLNDHHPRRASNGLHLGEPARVVPEGSPNQVRSEPLQMQMCPQSYTIFHLPLQADDAPFTDSAKLHSVVPISESAAHTASDQTSVLPFCDASE